MPVKKARRHNYPKKRQPTGARPTAGARAKIANRVQVSIYLPNADRDAFQKRHGKGWQDVVRRLIATHLHAA